MVPALMLSVACGESTGGKPAVQTIEEKLVEGGAPSQQANCIAKAMHANLDAQTLTAIIETDASDPLDALDRLEGDLADRVNANQTLTLAKAMASCVGIDPGAIGSG